MAALIMSLGTLLSVVVMSSSVPAYAQTGPLDGEAFIGISQLGDFGYCRNDYLGSGEIQYGFYGTATGPYPGVFVETGSVNFDPATGAVTAWKAQFKIYTDMSLTTVLAAGTKALAPNGTGSASCIEGTGSALGTQTASGTTTQLTYTCTYPCSGTGESQATFSFTNAGLTPGAFVETFGPTEPTSKADCLNGGYAQYGFKNQGQCIKYVNEHSKR